jgi:hypothetical protein
MINNLVNYGAIAVVLLLLAALGFQTYRLEVKDRDLKLAIEISGKFESAAKANYEILSRAKEDFNSSLTACFSDYSKLAKNFDDYRAAIAKSSVLSVRGADKTQPLEQNATCVIGGQNALIDALNAFN